MNATPAVDACPIEPMLRLRTLRTIAATILPGVAA
jgi:hypothetical protein